MMQDLPKRIKQLFQDYDCLKGIQFTPDVIHVTVVEGGLPTLKMFLTFSEVIKYLEEIEP